MLGRRKEMYSVSEHYKNAINKSNPSYLTGMITFKDGSTRELTMADIAIGGPSITMQAVTQDVLEFGAAVLGQLDISIITDKSESRYKYYDGVVVLDFNIETENGVETVPLGEYIIIEAEREKLALKLSAYDNLFKFEKAFSLQIVGTPFDLMSTLATDCGCELAEDEDYYKSLPNGDLTLTVNEGSSCNTYRQAASIIAQMCGCFVQADRTGKISMKQFSSTPTFALGLSQRYKSTIADYVCTYMKLEIAGLAGAFESLSENVVSGNTMYMEDAPAWDSGTEEVLQRKADNLMAYLENIIYTPCDLLTFCDPSIDCGDLIALETSDGTVNTLVTSYTWNFHAQMEIQSVGKNPFLLNNGNATTQRVIRDLEVNGSGGTPAALYTFKNTRKFKCSDKLEPLAGVTFVATKDTFVMFDATFQVDVEVDDVEHKSSFTILDSTTNTSMTYEVPYMRSGKTEVSIQYFYNNNAMIEPYILTLESGSHLITLHYPINAVDKDSVNRFEVKMSASSGSVSVLKDKFMGTISGQGLAGKPKWDGTITVEENMGAVYSIAEIKALKDFSADVTFSKPKRDDTPGFADRFGTVSIMTIGAVGFNDEFGVNRVVTNYTMNTKKASLYEFNKEYISFDDIFKLKDEYIYTSYEDLTGSINSGKMCVLVIKNDDKVDVENVEVGM